MDMIWATKPEWEKWAYCQDYPQKLYFAGQGGRKDIEEGKALCHKCPVQQNCLNYGIAHNEEGIWGGKTKAERDALPAFVTEYIKTEYTARGLMKHYLTADRIIGLIREAV